MIFLETIRGQISDIPPIWFMRQAGRYLPEYRQVREKAGGFWNLCFTPDKAAEVTLQPVRRFDVDAAIIFSDILVIPLALGQKVTFAPNHGPLLETIDWGNFLRLAEDRLDLSDLAPSYQAISLVREQLSTDKALIGFAGSPWTVATYMIDGGKQNRFKDSLAWIVEQPQLLDAVLALLTKATIEHLSNQVSAGANVVQIFDSWAAAVPAPHRAKLLIAPLQAIVSQLRQRYPHLPIIYFGRGVSDLYPEIIALIPDLVLGIDQQTSPAWVAAALPKTTPVQGNLSPETLVNGGAELEQEIKTIKQTFASRPYIFNLGHGILPHTPIDHVYAMIQQVRTSNV